MSIFEFFWVKKIIFMFEISTLEFVEMQSFILNKIDLSLRPKFSFWVIFGLQFKKKIVTFEISTLRFMELQSFIEKKMGLGPKIWVFKVII